MDFNFTKEQRHIKKAARKFAEGEIKDVAKEFDQKEEFPMELWKKACALGFVGVYLKKENGGPGLGLLEACLITEEFWRIDPGCGCLLLTPFGAELIQDHGTAAQKQKYLPPICKGEAIMASAITEPNAGSDIFAIKTTAVKEGDEYVINGSKIFITNGTIAHYMLVYCLSDSGTDNRKNRFSIFIVETDRPGFEATKIKGKLGIRASDTAELCFRNVRIPKENLLGEKEGEGFPQIMELFNANRLIAAAQGVGVAQGALDQAITYVKQRKTFGQYIGKNQAVQFKLAEMATRVEAARILTYQAASLFDGGKRDPKLIAMAKWYAGETGVRVTDDSLQLHGGYGYINECDIERFYRDAKIVEIYEATKEMEKATIAKLLLGKF
ncbi:MAG: acyl-CoA dehydrogenase family protein [Pseudomonadota bacterium]